MAHPMVVASHLCASMVIESARPIPATRLQPIGGERGAAPGGIHVVPHRLAVRRYRRTHSRDRSFPRRLFRRSQPPSPERLPPPDPPRSPDIAPAGPFFRGRPCPPAATPFGRCRLDARFSTTRYGIRATCKSQRAPRMRARHRRKIRGVPRSTRRSAPCNWPRIRPSRNAPLRRCRIRARRATARITWFSSVTPLHQAAEYGQKDVAALLLAKKADVNAKDKIGMTPLHRAAFKGYTDVVKLNCLSK